MAIKNLTAYPPQSEWHSLKPYLVFAYSDTDDTVEGHIHFFGCQLIMADEPEEAADKGADNISWWAEDNGHKCDVTMTQTLELVPLPESSFSQAVNDVMLAQRMAMVKQELVVTDAWCGTCWHNLPGGLTFKATQNWQMDRKSSTH